MSGTICRSCRLPVRWVRMAASGKGNPLDPDPSIKGNIAVRGGQGVSLSRAEAEEARARGDQLYVSHFATCSKADHHRKRKAPAS